MGSITRRCVGGLRTISTYTLAFFGYTARMGDNQFRCTWITVPVPMFPFPVVSQPGITGKRDTISITGIAMRISSCYLRIARPTAGSSLQGNSLPGMVSIRILQRVNGYFSSGSKPEPVLRKNRDSEQISSTIFFRRWCLYSSSSPNPHPKTLRHLHRFSDKSTLVRLRTQIHPFTNPHGRPVSFPHRKPTAGMI